MRKEQLTEAARARYARQLNLSDFGEEGQLRLGRAAVLVVGAGGLGSPAAAYLSAAGVGKLTVMDGDRVEMSNLQRQLLHSTADLGRMKTDSAAQTLRAINPHPAVCEIAGKLTPDNAVRLISAHDFVIDATDNAQSKFLINDACQTCGVAWCYGGIEQWSGLALTVKPRTTACLRCVFGAPSTLPLPGTTPAGPIGALPGVIGAVQALEAIKYLAGTGETLFNRLFVFDARMMNARTIAVRPDPECPCRQ